MTQSLPQTIGIDISKMTLDVHAHPCSEARQFANTKVGHEALVKWLDQWPLDRVAYEATGTYHFALEQALADLPLVKINPLRARRFAQATGTLAKTDRIDAAVLALMAATLQPDIRPVRSQHLAQLAELMNARGGLVRDRTSWHGAGSHCAQKPGEEPHAPAPQTSGKAATGANRKTAGGH